ncbi:unnamed protein product [Penicillium viridicatum]
MASIVVFITGANRGLGQGLVKYFIAKPDHIVIATVRDLTHSTAQALAELPAGKGSRIIVVNAVSLYQATLDLLQKSTGKPIYAIMGSGAGDLARQPPVPSAAYGASKSIVNWYGVRINAEDEWLNAFVSDPGWVQTDMGNAATQLWGMEEAPDTHEKSITGMVEVLSMGTKEQYGGSLCGTRADRAPNLGPTTELGFSHEILLQGKLYENTLAHQ